MIRLPASWSVAKMFTRLLPTSGDFRLEDARRLTLMFGTEEWQLIYEARLKGAITPAQAREEYVNLMRWRLERVLGYRWTHAMELMIEGNQPLYDMMPWGNKSQSSVLVVPGFLNPDSASIVAQWTSGPFWRTTDQFFYST